MIFTLSHALALAICPCPVVCSPFLLGMAMRLQIHAVHAHDAHMRIHAHRCACENLDAHQPHTEAKKDNNSLSHSSLYLCCNACSWFGSGSWMGFSPVWISKWDLKSLPSWIDFSHSVHLCDLSPLWVSVWFFRIPFRPIIFDNRHKGGASLQCA